MIEPAHDRVQMGAVVNVIMNVSFVTGKQFIFHEGDCKLLLNKICSMKVADKIQ
jgi:hypothetical protein